MGQALPDGGLGERLGEQEHVGGAGPRNRGHRIEQVFGQVDGLPHRRQHGGGASRATASAAEPPV